MRFTFTGTQNAVTVPVSYSYRMTFTSARIDLSIELCWVDKDVNSMEIQLSQCGI